MYFKVLSRYAGSGEAMTDRSVTTSPLRQSKQY